MDRQEYLFGIILSHSHKGYQMGNSEDSYNSSDGNGSIKMTWGHYNDFWSLLGHYFGRKSLF